VTWAYLALLILGALGCLGFIVHYSLSYPWWRSEEGRNLVAFSSIVLAFLVFFLSGFDPSRTPPLAGFQVRDWFRFGLFVLLDSLIWWRWAMFARIRRRYPHREAERA
jgi:hypothetical protein